MAPSMLLNGSVMTETRGITNNWPQRFVRVPILLAIVTVILAPSAWAQTVRIEPLSPLKIELIGGAAGAPWRIRYGTNAANFEARLYMAGAPAGHVYFAHGPWLRLIDVARGVVVGRWRFPGMIVGVSPAPAAGSVDVQFRISNMTGRDVRTATFEPKTGKTPNWESGALLQLRLSELEGDLRTDDPLSPDDARAKLAEFEDTVRRDPLSPWLRIAQGRLLRDAGDPRAATVINEAVRSETTDFTDLFRISAFLERNNLPEPAAVAFERGYRDYLQRGRDPRYMVLIARLILYGPFRRDQTVADDARRTRIERIYELSPTTEGAEHAWDAYASYWRRRGNAEEAQRWQTRGDRAHRESMFGMTTDLLIPNDQLWLVSAGATLALLLQVVSLYFKYLPQRRLDTAGQSRGHRVWRVALLNLDYWSRRERAMVTALVVIIWTVAGVASTYHRVITSQAMMPVNLGDYTGPDNDYFFTTRLPASPWRDLIVAIAAQQGGHSADAERRYRELPQFAQSWNNLGVLLQQSGRVAEGRQAFERAREIDPALAEPRVNLGEQVPSFAFEVVKRYRPDQAVLAPPSKEQMLSAWLGSAWSRRFLHAAYGPIPTIHEGNWEEAVRLWRLPTVPGLVFGIGLTIAVWLILPYREVTQLAGRSLQVLERILPGLSPTWGLWGVLPLVAWSTLMIGSVLWRGYLTPYLVTAIALPGVQRAFGLPPEATESYWDLNPNPVMWVAAIGILFAVNLLVLRRGRRVA